MVGKPQLYTYNLFNLFVVKGLLEFICICRLTRTISTLSIPKFSLSSHFPAPWFVLKLCIYYDFLRFSQSMLGISFLLVATRDVKVQVRSICHPTGRVCGTSGIFSGRKVHCFFVSALWTIGPWLIKYIEMFLESSHFTMIYSDFMWLQLRLPPIVVYSYVYGFLRLALFHGHFRSVNCHLDRQIDIIWLRLCHCQWSFPEKFAIDSHFKDFVGFRSRILHCYDNLVLVSEPEIPMTAGTMSRPESWSTRTVMLKSR